MFIRGHFVRGSGLAGGRALVALGLLFAGSSASALCSGDCDGSGDVRVEELITLVGLALNDEAAGRCAAGDRNANDRIGIDELVGAVGGALHGCATTPVEETAAAALALLRTTARVHGIVSAVSLAFDGAAGPQLCDLGGTLGSVCQDVGPGIFRSTVTTTDCRDDLREGTLALNGRAIVRGVGRCPDVILPNGLIFDFDWDMRYEDAAALPLLTSRLSLQVMVNAFNTGSPPCRVKGADVILAGELTYLRGEDVDIQARFDGARATTRLDAFSESCDAVIVQNTLDGPLALGTPLLENGRVVLLSEGLRVQVDRDLGSFDVSGEIRGDCFNGRAQVTTIEPFDMLLGAACFTRGVLRVDNRAGAVLIHANADGSVGIDTDTDGRVDLTHGSCEMLPRMCITE